MAVDQPDVNTALVKLPADFDPSNFDVADLVKTSHNERFYAAIQALKQAVNSLVDYELAHPKISNPKTRDESELEKKAARELAKREKNVKAQLSLVKVLFRASMVKVREEKARTADDKAVNDGLILGLSNLRYEEQSLRSEIAGAENYDHKYTKLPLISRDDFLALFPDHASASEHDLMVARIEHEHQDRVRNEERRQEKLKEKQKLISEVKKSKENLTNLDGMVDRIEEAMAPIRKVLAGDECLKKTEGQRASAATKVAAMSSPTADSESGSALSSLRSSTGSARSSTMTPRSSQSQPQSN